MQEEKLLSKLSACDEHMNVTALGFLIDVELQ